MPVIISRLNESIQDSGDHLSGILFELDHQIRKHAMKLPASRIIAPTSGNPEPFRGAAFVPEDAFAVVAVTQLAFFTGWANIITALR